MLKTCITCTTPKPLSDFPRDKNRRDGRRSSCKLCWNSRLKSDWHAKYGDKYRQRRADSRADRRDLINEAKECGCYTCPEDRAPCLDFHHLDETTKDYGVSTMLTFSRERIIAEIEKCVVLCSNCHRLVHAGYLTLLKV